MRHKQERELARRKIGQLHERGTKAGANRMWYGMYDSRLDLLGAEQPAATTIPRWVTLRDSSNHRDAQVYF